MSGSWRALTLRRLSEGRALMRRRQGVLIQQDGRYMNSYSTAAGWGAFLFALRSCALAHGGPGGPMCGGPMCGGPMCGGPMCGALRWRVVFRLGTDRISDVRVDRTYNATKAPF